MSTYEPGEQFISEEELKSLLDRWVAPKPSKGLDQRVANSYHTELESADVVVRSTPFPLSQNEVVKMKFCSTCKEEFADKFSFCPVDGTPLNAFVPEPEDTVNSASFSQPAVTGDPVMAGAGSAALVPRGEFHLTIMDDAGLVGRLAKEVTDVAHQYQLTWPEFKRDPFGFTKRSVVGYGQMTTKFFANRNVLLGLIVAILAVVGLVGIIGLLDRTEPGGISRAGFITFAVLAGLILATIFIVWLRKSQSGAVLGAPDAESNYAVFGMVAAFSVFTLLIAGGVLYNFWQNRVEETEQSQNQEIVQQFIDIPNEQPTPDEGTAGLNKGKGGGSKPKQEKPGGGGGGGREQ